MLSSLIIAWAVVSLSRNCALLTSRISRDRTYIVV